MRTAIIPRKYRELIALGVAFTTQCAYCIDAHTKHARANGASKQEIAEAAFVAAAVKAGGTLAHSLMALRIFDEEEKAGLRRGSRSAAGLVRARQLALRSRLRFLVCRLACRLACFGGP